MVQLLKGKKNNIAVINLDGIIGTTSKLGKGLNINNVNPLLEKAFKTKKLRAVAIAINSPGGSPVQSELIYNRIKELSEENKVPVFTFAQDVAASGGYLISLAGKEIYAHRTSIVGSIGVISSGFGLDNAIKKLGITRRVYAQGKNKSILDPFLKEDKQSVEILKNAQKEVFIFFKDLVKNNRKNKLTKSEDILFNGAFWSGKDAHQNGLIDGIGDVRSIMKEKFGKKINFIEIKIKKKGIIKELLSSKVSISSIIDDFFFKIEEKHHFGKFGL